MTISLRNLPPEIERAVVEKSRRDGISLNKAVAKLLETAIHPAPRNSDFDEFVGAWSPAEVAEFAQHLATVRQVDPLDWKP
jgi:hypothetical protein